MVNKENKIFVKIDSREPKSMEMFAKLVDEKKEEKKKEQK